MNNKLESPNLKYEKRNDSVFEKSKKIDDVEDRLSIKNRMGRRRPGKPRHIISKFLYRPERRKEFTNRKNLGKNVWIIEDMIKEDFDKKKLYQDLMKKAFLEGKIKKPRFHHGILYIDGVLHKD